MKFKLTNFDKAVEIYFAPSLLKSFLIKNIKKIFNKFFE